MTLECISLQYSQIIVSFLNKQYLLFINIFAKISPLLAILLLRYRIEAGKLIRKIAK